jgi:hypothetical protein
MPGQPLQDPWLIAHPPVGFAFASSLSDSNATKVNFKLSTPGYPIWSWEETGKMARAGSRNPLFLFSLGFQTDWQSSLPSFLGEPGGRGFRLTADLTK